MSPAGGRLVTGLGITLAVVFAVSAIAQLLPAFVVLATGGADVAGIDLMSRLREARALFAGASPYALPAVYAPYPPATYLFFGPLAALTDQDARVLWALTTIPLLLALGWFAAVRAPGGMAMRVAALMLPFGFSGVAYGVQQGQLHVHALAAVVGALALAARPGASLPRDLAAGVLFALSLSKPTLTAPFFPLLLALPGRVRPAVVAALVYGAATVAALGLVGEGVGPLLHWLSSAQEGASYGAGGSYGNVHSLAALGSFTKLVPVLTFALLGLAIVFGLGQTVAPSDPHRLALRLAVVAVIARVFVYHQDYDDTLVLLLLFGLLARPAIHGGMAAPLLVASSLSVLHLLPRSSLEIAGDAGSWLAWARPALWLVGAALCVRALAAPPREPAVP